MVAELSMMKCTEKILATCWMKNQVNSEIVVPYNMVAGRVTLAAGNKFVE